MITSNLVFNQRLEQLEQKISIYQGLLSSGVSRCSFPSQIEGDYSLKRNTDFMRSSRGVLIFGILIYLAFGISDFSLGIENIGLLWGVRFSVAMILIVGVTLVFAKELVDWVMLSISIGMTLAGLSIIFFMDVLDEPASYTYHLGMIPWQVYVIVTLRSYTRAIFICSVSVFVVYIAFSYSKDYQPFNQKVDEALLVFRHLFILFWGLLIVMGVYLGYWLEKSSRVDYVKNRLLALDSERLTLLTEELKLLSTIDSLTGLSNRRHFEYLYKAEWNRALRDKTSICLLMADIDFFKKYNDYYGHQEGDQCLQKVSKLLQTLAKRPGDLVSRYGGEEFIIMLPQTNLSAGYKIAESMCRGLEESDIPHAATELGRVTISIGVAAIIPEPEDSMSDLIKASDDALYSAKGSGRNRVAT